ncbi:hypothetical protein BSKO_12112 [Bryopsis sp. KO-2023]|nr:hypothetical protein BSKO_12112 [Bryopsis sp. KO-2023]
MASTSGRNSLETMGLGAKHGKVYDFPDQIVFKVLSFLDGCEVGRLASVCKQWAEVCRKDGRLWKGLVEQDFGGVENSITSWRDVYVDESNWVRREFDRRALTGHYGDVKCVQFDDEKIVSGSDDGTIRFWDMESGKCTMMFNPLAGCVFSLKFKDGNVYSSGSRPTISVHEEKSGQSKQTLSGHTDWVNCLDVDEDRLVSGSNDGLIKIWDLNAVKAAATLTGHKQWVRCIQAEGNRVVSGSSDETVKLWDVRTGDAVLTLEGHKACVTSLQFDRNKIISTSGYTNMKAWDVRTGECFHTFQTSPSLCVRFDGSKLVCGRHLNGFILIFDMNSLKWKRSLQGPHYLCSWCLEFSKKRIVCGAGSDVEVWTLNESKRVV